MRPLQCISCTPADKSEIGCVGALPLLLCLREIDTLHFMAGDVPDETDQFPGDGDVNLFGVFVGFGHGAVAGTQTLLGFPADVAGIV